MSINTQIISLFISFLYGVLTYFVYNMVSKWLFLTKTVYNVLANLIFVLIITIIYFIIMFIINCAVIHIYFLFMFVIGFLLSRYVLFKYKKSKLLKS